MEANNLPVRSLRSSAGLFPAQERGQPPLIEHVERLVPRHVLLQQAEAVRVDRPDERRAQPVKRLQCPSRSSTRAEIRALSSSAARSVNVNAMMPAGSASVGHEFGDALGHHLGLARASRSDDLQMRAAVQDSITGVTR